MNPVKTLFLPTLAAALLAVTPLQAAAAQDEHAAMSHGSAGQAQAMFLEKRDIDGYTVSFHVMAASAGMSHGGSHNLMIKVERDGQAVDGLQINSKVKFADGQEQSRMPMKMGDWYTAGYDLDTAGEHQLMVLFKTADGEKHFGGVHYRVN